MNINFSCNSADENNILSSLPAEDSARIRPHLEIVRVSANHSLYESGDSFRDVYFPLDAVIYLFSMMKSGATLEAGVVGAEGLLGFGCLLGAETIACHTVVLNAGQVLRINAKFIKQEFGRGGYFQQLILQYINSSCIQLSQTAACNHLHRLENRLPRWLLLHHDRLKSNRLKVTQGFIAQMLGTQRPYITEGINRLEKNGIIKCRRGSIDILNREKLEKCGCECYEILQREFNFLKSKYSLPAGSQFTPSAKHLSSPQTIL